jgi:nicotinamide-nucleotide amidase
VSRFDAPKDRRSRAGRDVFDTAGRIVREASARGRTIAVAESCTGGLVGAAITAVPGSSAVFWGSLVTYSYEAKTSVLGVLESTLEAHGAVSEAVVREMVVGLRGRSGCDAAVAVSGVAGPGGGTPEKPVGTVWIAWGSADKLLAQRFHFDGDRDSVRAGAVREALAAVLRLVSPA